MREKTYKRQDSKKSPVSGSSAKPSAGTRQRKSAPARQTGKPSAEGGKQRAKRAPRVSAEALSFCPAAGKCGSCQYAGIAYQAQLKKKQQQMQDLFGAYGRVEPIIGMEEPDHYRNKVHAVLGRRKDGTVISGTYEENSHRIVPVEHCRLENKEADAIIADTRKLLQSFKVQIYNENSGYGLVRHLLIRRGHHTGQVLLVIVAVSPIFPSKNNFVKALRKLHPEITSIVLNVNDRFTSMVLGKRDIPLYGKGYIEDTLLGKRYRISAQSFYQINTVQTEKLYSKALEYAALTGKERVVDAYCGIGTIGMSASDKAREVIGVELNPSAVRDARENARINEVSNITFTEADAGDYLSTKAAAGEKIDVLLMDPPRSGSTKEFLDSAMRMGPEKIVYISCEPTTLERDLRLLTAKRYRCERITPVDMFPHTEKIEAVCLLTRK